MSFDAISVGMRQDRLEREIEHLAKVNAALLEVLERITTALDSLLDANERLSGRRPAVATQFVTEARAAIAQARGNDHA